MKTSSMLPAILFALATMAQAEDMTLANKDTLVNISILEKGSDHVRIRHDGGIAKVKYNDLTPEWQKKLDLTPEQVTQRMESARQAAQAKADRIRNSFSESERAPRYLRGADIMTIFAEQGEISTREAEYLAALWNEKEARRLAHIEEAEAFRETIKNHEPAVSGTREKRASSLERITALQGEIATLQGQLTASQSNISSLQQQNKDLREAFKNIPRGSNTTMVVDDGPTIIPYPYPPQPIQIVQPVVYPRPNRPNHTCPTPSQPTRPSVTPPPARQPIYKPATPMPSQPRTTPIKMGR